MLSFFFNDPATTEIYTLSLHDALPISTSRSTNPIGSAATPSSTAATTTSTPSATPRSSERWRRTATARRSPSRSEEHTSELQSRQYLVCRLLLEKKKHNFFFYD